jgi:hypothetical protein
MSRRPDPALRRLLAQEAAKIIREQGVRDFGLAKRKARERLGLGELTPLPKNTEVEEALAEHQRLFATDRHAERLRELRETAREAMRSLEEFRPRLVGPVLSGTASEHAPVQLHLFAPTPELVSMRLLERHIPHDSFERRYRLHRGGQQTQPAFRFVAGDVEVELTVFSETGLRQAPLSPVDGRPMRRASLREVDELLDAV